MNRRADLILVVVTIIWGTTFSVTHQAVATFPPLALILLRFGLAALAMVPFVRPTSVWQQLGRRGIVTGIGLGTLLFLGFAPQTLGLASTSPARAGFITGLNVVLVPVFGLIWRERPSNQSLAGVLLAVAGLAVLNWGCAWSVLGCSLAAQETAWSFGDTMVVICAVAFAAHIVAVGRWGQQLPALPLNLVQLTTAAALSAVGTLFVDVPGWNRPSVWAAAAFLGVIATALVFAFQLWAQRQVSATRTALIFALEPVFAALFAWWWLHEQPNPAIWLGGCIMVLGVVVSEVPLRRILARREQVGL